MLSARTKLIRRVAREYAVKSLRRDASDPPDYARDKLGDDEKAITDFCREVERIADRIEKTVG